MLLVRPVYRSLSLSDMTYTPGICGMFFDDTAIGLVRCKSADLASRPEMARSNAGCISPMVLVGNQQTMRYSSIQDHYNFIEIFIPCALGLVCSRFRPRCQLLLNNHRVCS